MATAALAEVEVPLVNCLHELSRVSLTLGGAPTRPPCRLEQGLHELSRVSPTVEVAPPCKVAHFPGPGLVPVTAMDCLHGLSRVSLTLAGAGPWDWQPPAAQVCSAVLAPLSSASRACSWPCKRLPWPGLATGRDLLSSPPAAADPKLTPDWTHIFLTVLPPLPLGSSKDENRLVLALKAACAGIMTRRAPCDARMGGVLCPDMPAPSPLRLHCHRSRQAALFPLPLQHAVLHGRLYLWLLGQAAALGWMPCAALPAGRRRLYADTQAVHTRFGPALRRAKVAQVEIRLRPLDGSGSWRILVSSPSGAPGLCFRHSCNCTEKPA